MATAMLYTESTYTYILYIWSRVPCSHPPPWDGGGVWCPCGGVYTYIHTYIPTYLHTYVHTYIPLHYLTLPYLTLPYLTFHTYIHTYTDTHTYIHTQTHTHTYIHTYQHTYQHTNIPTYQHTNIPTYHHHRPRGGDQKNHTTTTGHKGGGPEEPDDTVHPYPLVGGEGGWPTLHHIYIYKYIQFYSISTVVKFTRGKDAQRLDLLNWCQVVQAFQVLRDSKLKELGSRW